MNLAEYENLEHKDYFSRGWNAAVASWNAATPRLTECQTTLTGSKRESFLEGWRAAQDDLILNPIIKP
jgi:hypothetical protein